MMMPYRVQAWGQTFPYELSVSYGAVANAIGWFDLNSWGILRELLAFWVKGRAGTSPFWFAQGMKVRSTGYRVDRLTSFWLGRVILTAWGFAILVVVSGSLLPALLLRKLPAMAMTDNDKAAHFAAYLLLAMLPVFAADLLRLGVALALMMIPLGIAIEFFQRLIPGRSFEVLDIIANSLGVLTGVLLGIWFRSWRRVGAPQTD
jgi:VanZ family protein